MLACVCACVYVYNVCIFILVYVWANKLIWKCVDTYIHDKWSLMDIYIPIGYSNRKKTPTTSLYTYVQHVAYNTIIHVDMASGQKAPIISGWERKLVIDSTSDGYHTEAAT